MSTETRGTSKDALLARMDEAWRSFAGPALALGERGLRDRTPVGWTYAQLLAHVRAWHELTVHRLNAYRETGEIAPPGGDAARRIFSDLGFTSARADGLLREWSTDDFNAAVAEAAASAPTHGMLPALYASFRSLRDAVAALSEEQVAAHVSEGRGFVEALVEGNTYGHYAEHQDELTPVLPRTGRELADRVEADWKPLREAVRRKGRAGLADHALESWTYKDLLAHVIGWLQDVPRRVAAIREGTHKPVAGSAEIDSYNARSVAERSLVGPEAILDELDASYRNLRDVLTSLTDAELQDPQIRGLVATRTYLHWDEHRKELGL